MGAGEALRRVLECLASGILMAGRSAPHFIFKMDYKITVCQYIKIQYERPFLSALCSHYSILCCVLLTNQHYVGLRNLECYKDAFKIS